MTLQGTNGRHQIGLRYSGTVSTKYCFCTGLEGLAEQIQFAETGVDVFSPPESLSRRTNLIPKPSLARAGES